MSLTVKSQRNENVLTLDDITINIGTKGGQEGREGHQAYKDRIRHA